MSIASQIREADGIEILVIVDDATDSLSSNPNFVQTETAQRRKRGVRLVSGKCQCCAAHGFSLLIRIRMGGKTKALLLDAGPAEWVFERNATKLAADLGAVEALVLSHGLWDHAGAMPRALQMIVQQSSGRGVPTYMHPAMFGRRGTKGPDGQMLPFEDVPCATELMLAGAAVVSTREPQAILCGAAYVSGEIPRVTPFETGIPGQFRQGQDGTWEPDQLVIDERFVAIRLKGKGLVVFTACSRAGIVNVLTHARDCFPGVPLHGVIGGLHLSGSSEKIIPQTVAALKPFGLKLIAAGHCTGWRGVAALAAAFGDKVVVPSAVGKLYSL